MMNQCVTRPMTPSPVTRPMVAGGVATTGAIWTGGGGCWPYTDPYPWDADHELERLRRLERDAQREQEKEAIRRRLRQMGVPEDRITGRPFPFPVGPLPLPRPAPLPVFPLRPAPPSLDEIIRQARKGSGGR